MKDYLTVKEAAKYLKKHPKIINIMKYLKRQYQRDSKFREQMEISLKKILRYKAYIFRKQNRDNYLSRKYFNIAKFPPQTGRVYAYKNSIFPTLRKHAPL